MRGTVQTGPSLSRSRRPARASLDKLSLLGKKIQFRQHDKDEKTCAVSRTWRQPPRTFPTVDANLLSRLGKNWTGSPMTRRPCRRKEKGKRGKQRPCPFVNRTVPPDSWIRPRDPAQGNGAGDRKAVCRPTRRKGTIDRQPHETSAPRSTPENPNPVQQRRPLEAGARSQHSTPTLKTNAQNQGGHQQ